MFGIASKYPRRGSITFNPAALNLSGWFENSLRGSGVAWDGKASAGSSGTRNATLVGGTPPGALTVAGKTWADISGGKAIRVGTFANHFSTSAKTCSWSFALQHTIGANAGAEINDSQIFSCSASIIVAAGETGPTAAGYGAIIRNASSGLFTSVKQAGFTSGAPCTFQYQMRDNAGQGEYRSRFGNGAWSSWTVTPVGFDAGLVATYGPLVLDIGNPTAGGAPYPTAAIGEMLFSPDLFSDAVMDQIKVYLQTSLSIT